MAATKMDKKKGSSVCRVFKNTCYAVMSNRLVLFPAGAALSSSERGLLVSMLNVPEYNGITFSELKNCFPADSPHELRTALSGLRQKRYVVRLGKRFAVNRKQTFRVV